MPASKPPNPRLGKSQALNIAQGTVARLAQLVPTLTTVLSPVTVYQPGVNGGVGNELTAAPGNPVTVINTYGVWVAPDLNGDGSEYYVTVECFGGGGGAGGGAAAAGGGGGGGGEYAREDQYPIVPGEAYAYVVGLPGAGGFSNHTQVNPGSAGTDGGQTIFDVAGLGFAGGVVANGGTGGDQTAIGIGGAGGTGSTNTVHFNGGSGGTNVSGNGSDNPMSLVQTSGMFTNNTLTTTTIKAWYVYNDGPDTTFQINDQSFTGNSANVTNFTGGLQIRNITAPAQVAAYASPASPPLIPNPSTAGVAVYYKLGSLTKASAITQSPVGLLTGSYTTISGWVQADPSGTWGNTAGGSYAVLASNRKNYFTNGSGTTAGHSLFLHNDGTAGSPNWKLYYQTGSGSASATISAAMAPTPGSWYYVVATFNHGAMTLYINGSSVATTTAGFTTVGAGAYAMAMGLDPSVTANWFFGYMSNFWFAVDSATSTLVTQAFGLTAPTAGAGGGASGGPSANGGNGATASGATGGAGGTPATQPASLSATTTQAMGGFSGANATLGNASPVTPAGGPYGGGGGGSGDMPSNPALTVLTVPFTSAATYNGPDAASNPGGLYNVNQQNHPSSGITSVLFAGGLPSDTDTGSKNSILLLPKGLAATLGNSIWTITNVFLTFTNAFPTNLVESVLEVGYSSDTVLPQSYLGASLIDYVGAVPVAIGAGTITYDLTQTGIITELQNGTATAFVIGVGSNPAFDAYSAQTGQQFYCSIYGPGAYDTFGNAQFPYLTIVLEKTLTTQQGSNGGGGGILITAVTNADIPVSFIEPFAGSDSGGNQFAQGYTGQATNFDPGSLTPGSYKPEKPHNTSGVNSFTTNPVGFPGLQYWLGPDNMVHISGCVQNPSVGGPLGTTFFTLPSAYAPASSRLFLVSCQTGSSSPEHLACMVDTSGNMTLRNSPGGTIAANTVWFCEFSYPSTLIPGIH